MKTCGIATKWVGLGLWGICVSYGRGNCILYARKHVRIIYTPKSVFSYQYHKFLFSFGVAYYLYAFSLDRALYNSTVVE